MGRTRVTTWRRSINNKFLIIILCNLALVASACAVRPQAPSTPITSVDAIAGKWQGTVFTSNGSGSPGVMTINANGTWVGYAFGHQTHGTFTLVKGEALWKTNTTGATGTWILRMVKGMPVLDGRGSNGISFESKRAG